MLNIATGPPSTSPCASLLYYSTTLTAVVGLVALLFVVYAACVAIIPIFWCDSLYHAQLLSGLELYAEVPYSLVLIYGHLGFEFAMPLFRLDLSKLLGRYPT